MIPNLYADHMAAKAPLANTSQVVSAIYDRMPDYEKARIELGLSRHEFDEFLEDVTDDSSAVSYGPLPRHMDGMAGRRHSGTVYPLHNVRIPADTYGWTVKLKDGTKVYIPSICGNLSMSRGTTPSKPFHNVSFKGYFPPTEVTFAPPPTPSAPETPEAPQSAPEAAPEASAPTHHDNWGFAALLFPITASFAGGGGSLPHCSLGSNIYGACSGR
jgi:hypothetical protein